MDMQTTKLKGVAGDLGKRIPFEQVEEELYVNLLRAFEHASGVVGGVIKTFGLSEPQYNVLRILRGHEQLHEADPRPEGPGVACGKIGAQMVSREPDVSRLIDRLEKAGLVERERCEHDRRVVRAVLTDAGRAKVDAIDAPLRAAFREAFGSLGAGDIETLNRALYVVHGHGE